MPQELPAPAYDKHTAANGFGFTLDVSRMHNSDSWAVCPPEIRPWMMATWITSWTQRPCGSLPSDDDLLAARLGCTLDFLRVHRRFIMRGWVLHADGRFYHPVVTEAVLKMVKKREDWAKSKSGRRANNEKQEVTENVLQDSGGSPIGVHQVSSSYSYSSTSTSDIPVTTKVPTERVAKTATSARGARLSLSVLPDEWRAWASKERPDLDAEATWQIFMDHWTAIPGARGCKADWLATWRNWVRREKSQTGDKNGQHNETATDRRARINRTLIEAGQRAFDEMGCGPDRAFRGNLAQVLGG